MSNRQHQWRVIKEFVRLGALRMPGSVQDSVPREGEVCRIDGDLQEAEDYFLSRLFGGNTRRDERWQYRMGRRVDRMTIILKVEGYRHNCLIFDECAEIPEEAFRHLGRLDLGFDQREGERIQGLRGRVLGEPPPRIHQVRMPDGDELQGPGIKQWLRVQDSEQELADFWDKCRHYGFKEPDLMRIKISGELHCFVRPDFEIQPGPNMKLPF